MAEEAAAVETPAAEEQPAAESATETKGGEEKLLPQSEVDRIVQERLARATKGQPSKDELAELRRIKEAHDAQAEAAKTELEKANERAQKAEEKAQEAIAKAEQRLKDSAVVQALAKAGVQNVEGALRALDKTGLAVEDDGTVSGAEEAVQALLEQIPEFVGKVVPPKVDQGARGTSASDGQVTAAQLETMSPEEIAKATRQGRMKDLLG